MGCGGTRHFASVVGVKLPREYTGLTRGERNAADRHSIDHRLQQIRAIIAARPTTNRKRLAVGSYGDQYRSTFPSFAAVIDSYDWGRGDDILRRVRVRWNAA